MTDYQVHNASIIICDELRLLRENQITLRDFFAGCALQGLLVNTTVEDWTYEQFAEWCFHQADAMLKERESEAE